MVFQSRVHDSERDELSSNPLIGWWLIGFRNAPALAMLQPTLESRFRLLPEVAALNCAAKLQRDAARLETSSEWQVYCGSYHSVL